MTLGVIHNEIGTKKMSRLAREYPEATEEELYFLAMRATTPRKEGEPRYQYECRSCGDTIWVGQDTHDRYEENKRTGIGFTIPKCGPCWA